MGRLLAGRHAGDENLLARAPGLAEVAATIELTSRPLAPARRFRRATLRRVTTVFRR